MKGYMKRYEGFLQDKLNHADGTDWKLLQKEVLVQIQFMQHERLIHFLVTMLFALLFLISLGILLFLPSLGMLLLTLLLLALLIPYIAHYYFLENTVQKMYLYYNRIAALADGMERPNTKTEDL